MSKKDFYNDMANLQPPYPLTKCTYIRYAMDNPAFRETCPLTALALQKELVTVDNLWERHVNEWDGDIVKDALAAHYDISPVFLGDFITVWDTDKNPSLEVMPKLLAKLRARNE